MDEIASVRDNPSDVIFDEFEERLFGKHPLGRTILGTPESVKSLRKNDIQSFVKRNYSPDQMVFASVGSTPIKKLKRILIMKTKYLLLMKPRKMCLEIF